MKKLFLLLLLCLMAGNAAALNLPEPYGETEAGLHYLDANGVSLGTELPHGPYSFKAWFLRSHGEVLLCHVDSYPGYLLTEVTIGGNVYPVTGIWINGNDGLFAANINTGITNLTIPEGMKLLGGGWFALNTPNLPSLTIPSTMVYIGEQAFRSCTSLKEVTFTDGDAKIQIGVDGWGNRPFYWCPVETCYLGRNYTCSTQLFNDLKQATISGKVTQMPDNMFKYYSSLETLTLMEGIPYISNSAFFYCSSLTQVTIPNSVKKIGSQAFETMNSSLTDLDLGHGVEYLGWRCFQGHSLFNDLTLPASLDSIDALSFRGCNGIQRIVIEDTSKPLQIVGGDIAFSSPADFTVYQGRNILGSTPPFKTNTGLKAIEMSNYVTQIAPDYCSRCSNLATVKLSENITEIPSCAFFYCSALTSIKVPNAVKTIGSQAFETMNSSLTDLDLGRGVKYLGWRCFQGHSLFNYLTLPASLDSIDALAFRGCNGIQRIVIENSSRPLKIIGGDVAFNAPVDFTVYQGRNIQSNTPPFKGVGGLKSIEMGKRVTEIAPDYFSRCSNLNSVKLSKQLTEIPNNTFFYCTSLTYIDMGDAITRIGSQAFESAALKKVKMGTGLTYIDGRAFWNCGGIEEIVCMATTPPECANQSMTFSSNIYSTASLEVKQSSIEDYKEAPVWKNFLNISVASILGDVDGDGRITIADVTDLIDLLMGGDYNANGDMDGDGQNTIGDAADLIDLLFGN